MSRAIFRYVRISPIKTKAVVDLVRGKDVQEAIDILKFSRRKAAQKVLKLIKSAVSNESQKGGVDIDNLYIKSIEVGKGPYLKRWRARARGMAARFYKKTAHISVELAER